MFQSLTEVNCSVSDQRQSKHRSGYLVPEIDAADQKMQVNADVNCVCGLLKTLIFFNSLI